VGAWVAGGRCLAGDAGGVEKKNGFFFFFFALLRETDCIVLDPWTRIEGGHG
jgi:hypothetical protein